MSTFEETVTGIRVQARIEALDALHPPDRDLVSNAPLDGAAVKAAYDLYVRMSGVFFGALGSPEALRHRQRSQRPGMKADGHPRFWGPRGLPNLVFAL